MARRMRLSAFDLVEGFHLAHAVATLHEQGVLQSLRCPRTAEQLANRFGWDVPTIGAVLEYITARTDLLSRKGGKYRATEHYETDAQFLLDQYIGAYGPCVCNLSKMLSNPNLGATVVDRRRHAEAFANLGRCSFSVLQDLVLQLRLNYLLDLGCGPGSLLLALAQKRARFRGWGVDANPAACAIARRRLLTAGVSKRIGIVRGDCRNLCRAFPKRLRARVRAISAASLVNEFFGAGEVSVIAWLRCLRALFPGRALLVGDYYGRLGRKGGSYSPRTILHDFVQVLSGQGVPPANRQAWMNIYAAAGCNLIHVVEDEKATWFVHLLRL